MIIVSQATKEAWASGSSKKNIRITIERIGTITNADIVQDSFSITESIMSGSSLELVGCIARKLSFTTSAFTEVNLKNRRVQAWVSANNTDLISVFYGIIDESKKQSNKGLKDIFAYDDFYRLSKIDATGWWNGLGQSTIYESFLSFIAEFNLRLMVSWFVNGNKPCFGGTKRSIQRLSALDYLKQICQINGAVGYIDGQGYFNVIHLPDSTVTEIPYYKDFEYEDYSVKEIEKVTIRNSSEDVGVSYPYSGQNNYIIQGNIFAYDQTANDLLEMAQGIYGEVEGIQFKPFSGKHNAYPYLECGDIVRYTDYDDEGVLQTVDCYVMSRILSGDQAMWDEYSAEGEENQRIFITDLQAQLNDLQEQINEATEDTPNGSLFGMVAVEYTQPIETPTLGGYDETISGIATEVT